MTKIRARLLRAADERLHVRIRRWIPGADRLAGFVVGLGEEWVAVAYVSQGIHLDGWCLLRIDDVQAVRLEPDPDAFVVRALAARGEWPPQAPAIDLEDVRSLVRSVAAEHPVVAVHTELDDPDTCWVGTIVTVGPEIVELLDVSPRAVWSTTPRPIDLHDVTRIDVGGDYEDALATVAGAPPR